MLNTSTDGDSTTSSRQPVPVTDPPQCKISVFVRTFKWNFLHLNFCPSVSSLDTEKNLSSLLFSPRQVFIYIDKIFLSLLQNNQIQLSHLSSRISSPSSRSLSRDILSNPLFILTTILWTWPSISTSLFPEGPGLDAAISDESWHG